MRIDVDIQRAADIAGTPADGEFNTWAKAALAGRGPAELTIRVVDEEESERLNSTYRGKDGPTNVLSFPADLPDGIDLPLLGDIVICAPLVEREAGAQGKRLQAHWAHLVIHGILHLLGHDHQREGEARERESNEVRLLGELGFSDPYR